MMRLAALMVIASLALVSRTAYAADRWSEYSDSCVALGAIEPTPTGEGHLGVLDGAAAVALRIPIPAEAAEAYFVDLGNVVAFSGRGTSYQIVVRRSDPEGEVLWEGPVIANGDAWNTSNREPVDLTAAVTEGDRARGWLDLSVSARVADDGWTMYRSNPARPVQAFAAIPTAGAARRAAAVRELADRGVSILPIPHEMSLGKGDLALSPATRIVYEPTAPASVAVAARELQALVHERTGLDLEIAEAIEPAAGDLGLAVAGATAWPTPEALAGLPGDTEGYVLSITAAGARVFGAGEAGCFYGAMTLGQMSAQHGGKPSVPLVQIRDWPAFPNRIIQYDVARGQTINVPYVKRMIREFARCKVNALLFYMEDDFRFQKYPFLGREGTFTHEKARELSKYAHELHMELIPQFESLGHASAVLAHGELAHLREAGGSWVFCTCEPRTWEFLDDVYGELVEAFPYCRFIHVGGDEFEDGFGKCERCQARIAQDGIGGLYSEHMNKLNALVKKHERTMLFWPAHWGPTPELTQMSLRYKDLLDKDCVPTEWIYHGPSVYPEIEAYQSAGYQDIYCSPAVESYSRIWPDHTTTFRGIRGFYQAGAARGSGGAYCTTWEFMSGALIENSWYGLIFAAECSWSPDSTRRPEYDRRFADLWWGLTGADVVARMADPIFCPFPASGPASTWRNGWLVRNMLWVSPTNTMREYGLKNPDIARLAPTLCASMDAALANLQPFTAAPRNQLTTDAASLAFRMMRYAGAKVVSYGQCAELYRKASAQLAQDATGAADALAQVSQVFAELHAQAQELATGYGWFVANCGAYVGDRDRLQEQADELASLQSRIEELCVGVRAGTVEELPPGSTFGFLAGTYTRLGGWSRDNCVESGMWLTLDATAAIAKPGVYQVEFEYERGAHGMSLNRVQLLANGQPVADDAHSGWTGAGSRGNVYSLSLPEYDPSARYEVVAEMASSGGIDSFGTIWFVAP